MTSCKHLILAIAVSSIAAAAQAQESTQRSQAELRGSVTPERAWWDLKRYDLSIEVFPATKTLAGKNVISFTTLEPGKRMQLDLQPPLAITRITHEGKELHFEREGNVYWVDFAKALPAKLDTEIVVHFEGRPTESRRPPWSGGLTWKKDSNGKDFIATTCQGIGASIWWPNKDHGYDEPDRGMSMTATVPFGLVAVSNGRLKEVAASRDKRTTTFRWEVVNPINNYGVNLNIGNYVHWDEVYHGEGGKLDVEYWALEQDLAKAKRQFVELPRVLEAFEYWFGKYPFYEDSFKLVEVPYLGMEHQSCVTYGNGFANGYRGRDLSRTGVGLKFDFIIVHESAHEWFGNNVSMKDAADMWIHEGFANYAESLFVEYFFTRKEAEDYVIGTRALIRNDRPIIGKYGRNIEGSGDMYYKGGNMLHTLRHVIDNDIKWRRILRGINSTFWHRSVTTQQVEGYIAQQAGMDLSAFFEQYLRTTKIPVLEYAVEKNVVRYRYTNVVDGFAMPIEVYVDGKLIKLAPTAAWQELKLERPVETVYADRNFYVRTRQITGDK